MDVFSHGAWSAVAATAANRTGRSRRLNLGLAAFWGVFPDIFAFALPFFHQGLYLFFGVGNPALVAEEGSRVPVFASSALEHLARQLYSVSHSLVVFALVFAVVWFFFRWRSYEMLAWPLHILVDIPTHTAAFFPTPFLWPISSFTISGFAWSEPWFMALNYGALAVTIAILTHRKRRKM